MSESKKQHNEVLKPKIYVLAKFEIGNFDKSKVVYLTIKEFGNQFVRKLGDRTFYTQEEAVQWSKGGRLGSCWQVGNIMYLLVEKVNDNPFDCYKKPEAEKTSSSRAPWGGSESGSSEKNCSGGDCGSGCNCMREISKLVFVCNTFKM